MNRALFLDRDGVLNFDHGYIGKIADFEVIPGVFEALAQAVSLGYRLIIITNQSGIARGYFSEADYRRLEDHMVNLFAARAIHFAGIYHCPHHPDGAVRALAITCGCRKPSPGMILQACAEHDLDLSRSILVGDKRSDIEAGEAAGVGYSYLLDESDPAHFASLADLVLSPIFAHIGIMSAPVSRPTN